MVQAHCGEHAEHGAGVGQRAADGGSGGHDLCQSGGVDAGGQVGIEEVGSDDANCARAGAHDAAEGSCHGGCGDVGAAGHVEDGLVDHGEANGSCGDGADADGCGGEQAGAEGVLGAVAQGVADGDKAAEVDPEACDAHDDGDDHADVDDVGDRQGGAADDDTDEGDQGQQGQAQVGDLAILGLGGGVVLDAGGHGVGLTLGLSALEGELDVDAAHRDGDDGAHDAHDGGGGQGDAAAVGSVDPGDGGDAGDHGHGEGTCAQGPCGAEQVPGDVGFLEQGAGQRDQGEHRHEHGDAGVGQDGADERDAQQDEVGALLASDAHDGVGDGLGSTGLVHELADDGATHEDEQVLLDEAGHAGDVGLLCADHRGGQIHAVGENDDRCGDQGRDENVPALHGSDHEDDEADDDAENAYDFHLLSSFSMVVAGRLRASSFLPFFPSSAPSQAP